MKQKIDRIESAIRHIQSAVDVDPWAAEIAVEAMRKQTKTQDVSDKDDCINRKAALKICRKYWHPTFNPIMEEIEKLPPERMSRKEVIEKIKKITYRDDFKAFVKSLNLSRDDYKTMMEYIGELSVAQPDHIAESDKKAERTAESAQPEITRCKDCKYMIDTGDDLMCDNAKGWVVATTSDFGCVLAERRMERDDIS